MPLLPLLGSADWRIVPLNPRERTFSVIWRHQEKQQLCTSALFFVEVH